MGNDGGSIARRSDLVKVKSRDLAKQVDQRAVAAENWKHCALSKQPLQQPIVACQLGYLYNKSALIEYLLAKQSINQFAHLRSLKDVQSVNITLDEDGTILCPITAVLGNGINRFVLINRCGCIVSERAIKQLQATSCPLCSQTESKTVTESKQESNQSTNSFSPVSSSPSSLSTSTFEMFTDYIPIFPSANELIKLIQRLQEIKKAQKAAKDKEKTAKDNSSAASASIESKQTDGNLSTNGTSHSHSLPNADVKKRKSSSTSIAPQAKKPSINPTLAAIAAEVNKSVESKIVENAVYKSIFLTKEEVANRKPDFISTKPISKMSIL